MAIYSFNMSSIGRSTHAPRAAGAHVRYITRPGAQPEIFGARMPAERNAARRWLDAQEKADRKNARMIDKIRVALPRELNRKQRRRLVEDFGERATQQRASWLAAIHQDGKDAHNPHAHIVIRDRDPETKERVAKLSDSGSCEKLRELWEEVTNAALQAAGRPERVTRRSHAARGLETPPDAHRGVCKPPKGERKGNPPRTPQAPCYRF